MKFRLSIILAAAAVGLAFSAVGVEAAIIVGLNQDNYVGREQLATYTDGTHTYAADTSAGGITVGDHLYGMYVATAESALPLQTTGAFDIVVAKIVDAATGASITDASGHLLGGFSGTAEVLFTTDNATLSSGQTGGFLTGSSATTYHLVDGSSISGLNQAANTMDTIFLNSTWAGQSGLVDQGSQAHGITNTTNGALYNDFGLGTALTDTSTNASWGASGTGYWVSDVSVKSGVVQSGSVPFVFGLQPLASPPATAYHGLFNELIGLQKGGEATGTDGTNISNNNGATPLGPGGSTTFAFVGGGHANVNTNAPPFGPSVWPTSAADPVWLDPITPEPGTLLMIGMGLTLGLPYLRRRQKVAA